MYGFGKTYVPRNGVGPTPKLVAEAAEQYQAEVKKAMAEANSGDAKKEATADAGETVFQTKCSACHAMDVKVVGPPVTEMVEFIRENRLCCKTGSENLAKNVRILLKCPLSGYRSRR